MRTLVFSLLQLDLSCTPPAPASLSARIDSNNLALICTQRRARFGEAAPLDPEAAAAAAKARADAAAAEAAKKASRAAKFGLELPDPVEVAAAEARAAKAALLGQLKLKPHQVGPKSGKGKYTHLCVCSCN